MQKRGQATIFIVVGIVLFIFIGIIYYLSNVQIEGIEQERQKKILPVQIQPLNIFVESCLEETSEEALKVIGVQGGYMNVPEPKINEDPFSIVNIFQYPYYLYLGQVNIPSLRTIEAQISSYVNAQIGNCINNFSQFEDYDITQGKIFTTAKILDDKVLMNLNYPLRIEKNSVSTPLSDFDVTINSRLDIIYKISRQIVELQRDNENNICLSCLVDIGEKNDLYIEMYPYEDNSLFYIIQDNKTRLNEQTYEYVFAIKFPEK